MDRDHRLDAPNEESLETIEQLDDHSGLTTIYPHAHQEWEGNEIVPRDVRQLRHDEEQIQIGLALRKWFVPIGIFIPLPFIVIGILVTLSINYISIDKMGFLVFLVIIFSGFALFGSYRLFKYGYKIFYKHGVRAWPFVFALLILLALSLHAIFLLTQPLHTGEQGIDVLIISAALFLASIVYSFIMVFIWSSPRMRSGMKLVLVVVMGVLVLAGTALLHLR